MKTNEQPWPWPFRSCAAWPAGTFPSQNELTRDYHHSREQAEGVCSLLHAKGAGGDGNVFPLRTWVEQAKAAPVAEPKRFRFSDEPGDLLYFGDEFVGALSLPHHAAFARLLADAEETARQRDELLAACKDLIGDMMCEECTRCDGTGKRLAHPDEACHACAGAGEIVPQPAWPQFLKAAQAAIARCQPAEKGDA